MSTWNDPSPTANPFNSRQFSNFSTRKAAAGQYISHTANPSRLTVPNQDIPYNGSPEWQAMRQNGLTVPNQDIPLGDQLKGSGFLPGNDDIFRLADGTLVNFKTQKILRTPNNPDSEYWGDPNKEITMDGNGVVPVMNNVSRDIPMEELINNIDRYKGTALPGGEIMEPLDPASAAYWLKAEIEAEKLKASMTDDQIATLAQFEAHFPKSRLIEEARKLKTYNLIKG